jgi:hypothetical protein
MIWLLLPFAVLDAWTSALILARGLCRLLVFLGAKAGSWACGQARLATG